MEIDWRVVALTLDELGDDYQKRFEGTSYRAAALVLKSLAGALGKGILAAQQRPPVKPL